MLKIPVKRILFAAATASSLAAVVAPQAASAAEVRCRGGSSCETASLQASRVTRVVRHAASARGVFNVRVFGRYEVRDVRNGVRVNGGRFFGSTSGHTGGLFSRYNLRVSSSAFRARVEGRLWTP